MAGDWIKMRTNLDTHPKVIELASILETPEIHIVGALWKVWSWADSHSIDGNAINVTCVTLDRFTGINGFAVALRNVGWLEGRDAALTFPRFAEHNGQTAKKRAETAERVRKHRANKSATDCNIKVLPEKRREEKSIKTPLPPSGGISSTGVLSDLRVILKQLCPTDRDRWRSLTADAAPEICAAVEGMGGWDKLINMTSKEIDRAFRSYRRKATK